MRLYEETEVTCIKENNYNLEVGKAYEITYLEWDGTTGTHSEVWLDDGSKDGVKIPIDKVEGSTPRVKSIKDLIPSALAVFTCQTIENAMPDHF